jgi:hypothetical protein
MTTVLDQADGEWVEAFAKACRGAAGGDSIIARAAIAAWLDAPPEEVPADAAEAAYLFVARAALSLALNEPSS